MIIRGRWIAALCALLMFMSACNGDADEPATLPDITATPETDSPTPTPTPTPTVEPPVEPPNAHEYSAEGVEAFTLYAIDVINYAYQTNDVSYLEQIMTANCEFCAATVNQLTTIGDAGGRIEGGQMRASTVSVVGPSEGVQTSAGIELTITASQTTDGEGRVRNTEADRDRYFIFNLAWEEHWHLAEVLSSEDRAS